MTPFAGNRTFGCFAQVGSDTCFPHDRLSNPFLFHSKRIALMPSLPYSDDSKSRHFLRLVLYCYLAFFVAIFAFEARAQDNLPVVNNTELEPEIDFERVTPAKIKDLQTQLDNATDLDEDAKAKIGSMLSQGSDELSRAAKLEASVKQDRSLVQNVKARLDAVREEVTAGGESTDLPPESATLTELESDLAQRVAKLQDAKNQLTGLQSELSRRADRRKQIAMLQASHGGRVAEAERQLATSSPPGESSLMMGARRLLQLAKLQALGLELPAYQWELARYDGEDAVDFQAVRVEQAKANLARDEAAVAELNQRIDVMRKQQARSRVEQLRDLAELIAAPELKSLALRNAELAEENEEVVEKIGDATTEMEGSQERLDTLRDLDQRTRDRVSRVGRSGAIGLELRKQRSILPNVRDIDRQGWSRQELMRDVELRRLTLEDDLAALLKRKADPNASGLEERIFADQVSTLQTITKNYDKYFQQLSEVDFSQSQLINATNTYRSFLDENVLWIRSNGFFDWTSLKQAGQKIREITNPESWADVGRSLWVDAFGRPWLYMLGAIAFLLLMPARYRGRDQLIQFGKAAERPSCTEFSVTIRAAILTLTIAIVWPAVLVFIGWRLVASPLDSAFPMAVGRAMIATAGVLTLLNVVRHSCREEGLARSHFGWPSRVTDLLRSNMRQLRFLLLPLVFMVVLLRELGGIDNDNGLERLCLSASLLVLGWTLYGIFHPRTGVIAEYLQRNSAAWYARTKSLWSWLLIGFPIMMAILIISGFYYTASELTWRFWHTIWIAVSLVALRAFSMRALQVNHRKIRIQKMKDRRASQSQASTSGQPVIPEVSVSGEALTLENEYESLRTNSEQVIRILHSALLLTGVLLMWFLWSGLFPALGILDEVTLWQSEREVAIDTQTPDGGISRTIESRVEPITLINLLAAIFVGLITFTLVRNVPGLIELTILQRLPLEASFKFAIVTMCRYVILVVGILLAFSAIGASWSKVQWLVAALTVGLGFGLQEIFGNFVSGIIILWERPVRIGDVVTLDNVSGTVSRIQMRATTISDWDRKEYIVPNKDFVTGRLLNWTRSDQVSRIVIPVGVAYGSDVRLAIRLLIQAANEHPRILDDPPPVATFDGFGDSTLNLFLRCFMPNLETRLETLSELNLAIDDSFREAGIEIAFPQQDLHIRSIPAGWQSDLGDAGNRG